MRRTTLSAVALACTAVLASAVPALADGASPTPTTTTAPRTSTAAPAPVPATTRPANPGQVVAVPRGAADTGVPPVASHSGTDGGLIGGSAALVLAIGGGAVLVVRRRRAAGA
jgi:hypothetical protein